MKSKISVTKKSFLLSRDDYKCQYCGVDLADENFTVDHKIPKSGGGSNKIENLFCCCRNCNNSKGTKDLEQFRTHLRIKKSKYCGLLSVDKFYKLISAGAVFGTLPEVKFFFEDEK